MKKTGRIVGLLFVLIMVTWGVGYYILDSILYTPDYLSEIYPQKGKVRIGVLFELVEVALVMLLAFVLYPILRTKNETLAISYVGFRVFESMMLIVSIMAALLLITLSEGYILAGTTDTLQFEVIGSVFQELRAYWSLNILALFHPLAAIPMYWFFVETRVIPRFISIWGLIAGVGLILDEVILEAFGLGLLRIDGMPVFGLLMGANEIVMGIWLMVKGFNEPQLKLEK